MCGDGERGWQSQTAILFPVILLDAAVMVVMMVMVTVDVARKGHLRDVAYGHPFFVAVLLLFLLARDSWSYPTTFLEGHRSSAQAHIPCVYPIADSSGSML